jgi:hypothetical protein
MSFDLPSSKGGQGVKTSSLFRGESTESQACLIEIIPLVDDAEDSPAVGDRILVEVSQPVWAIEHLGECADGDTSAIEPLKGVNRGHPSLQPVNRSEG